VEIPESTVPESFKVLLKELNSLGLDVIPVEPKEVLVPEEDIDEIEKDKQVLVDDEATPPSVAEAAPADSSTEPTPTTNLDDIEGPTDEELKKETEL